MTMRTRMRSALLGLALALACLPAHRAAAETCTAENFGEAVDDSAAELRTFSTETQPKLKQKLQDLRDKKKWTDPDFEIRGLGLVHDKKLDEFDAKAGELLSRIDTLGSPETDITLNASCANLADLKAASSELIAVMRAKSDYLIAKIDREIAAPSSAAEVEVARRLPDEPAPKAVPIPAPEPKAETAKPKEEPPPAAAKDNGATGDNKAAGDKDAAETTSSWSTTTAQAIVPPHGPPPAFDPPQESLPGEPYALPQPGDGPYVADDDDGYTIDEIREATRGFFGTISTSLASVIEHTFKQTGRPTGYVLGNEGGGAFLAGLRYGEGTLYLRTGGTQKVYWHGPSIGYDVGAEGSRTLFLIYNLEEPDTLFRRYTGVDGSAYLVGGVGMTLLKGGPVLMAPIRSGLGLRLGANIGYVRFTPRPTWNPF